VQLKIRINGLYYKYTITPNFLDYAVGTPGTVLVLGEQLYNLTADPLESINLILTPT
jgi:hypothetical protein